MPSPPPGSLRRRALTGGFHLAFLIAAGLILAAVAVALTVLKPENALAAAAASELAGAEAGGDGGEAYREAA